jgi:hypothetical protein
MGLFDKLNEQIALKDIREITPEEYSAIEEQLLYEGLLDNLNADQHQFLEELLIEKMKDYYPEELLKMKGKVPSEKNISRKSVIYGGTLALAFAPLMEPLFLFAGLAGGVIYYMVMKVIRGDQRFLKKNYPKYEKLLKLTESDPVSIEIAKRINDELEQKKPNKSKLKLLRKEFLSNLNYLLKYATDPELKNIKDEMRGE